MKVLLIMLGICGLFYLLANATITYKIEPEAQKRKVVENIKGQGE